MPKAATIVKPMPETESTAQGEESKKTKKDVTSSTTAEAKSSFFFRYAVRDMEITSILLNTCYAKVKQV